MKRITVLLIGILFCSIALPAQTRSDIINALSAKDFSNFKKYTDKLTKQNARNYWEYNRSLVDNFEERVFNVEITGSNDIGFRIYRINIITQNNLIIFFEMIEWTSAGSENIALEKFKNADAWDILRNSFRHIFHLGINEKELFITDFVYGTHCYAAGVDPEGKKQIDAWVKKNDKAALINWLQSTNTEKQVYAVSGLYQLKVQGLKLTPDELNMINTVLAKKGEMCTCSGCILGTTDINEVTRAFKF